MGKEVREILRFFVAPPREFPLSVCALTHLITQKISTPEYSWGKVSSLTTSPITFALSRKNVA